MAGLLLQKKEKLLSEISDTRQLSRALERGELEGRQVQEERGQARGEQCLGHNLYWGGGLTTIHDLNVG